MRGRFKLIVFIFASLSACLRAQVMVDKKEMKETEEIKTPIYDALVPKVVRKGFDVSFTISFRDVINPVRVTSYFRFDHDNEKMELQANETLTPERKSAVIKLGKLPLNYNGSRKFRLRFVGFRADNGSSSSNEELFSNEYSEFELDGKCSTILIQTDKRLYKPGQTVKFRGVALSPELKPLNHTMTYKVVNGDGQTVMVRKGRRADIGVLHDSIQIHPTSQDGTWTITFVDDVTSFEESASFSVELYKLPKFELNIIGPPYMTKSMERVTVKVQARYTYGKPVKGSGSVKLKSTYYGESLKLRLEEFDGEAEAYFTKEDVLNAGHEFSSERESRAEVEAEFVETHTGEKMSSTFTIALVEENLKVDKLFAPAVYKPGLNFTAYVKVSEMDGNPLKGNSTLRVKMFYRKINYRTWWDRHPEFVESFSFPIPPDGVTKLNIEVNSESRQDIRIECYIDDKPHVFSSFTAERAESSLGHFMQISTEQERVRVGSNSSFVIRTNQAVTSLEVTIMSKGRMIGSRSLSSDLPTTTFNMSMPITESMQPSVSLLAFYPDEQREAVTDLITVNVDLVLKNEVRLSASSERVDAGDHVTVTVRSSRPGGDFVGVRAVDASVLLLPGGDDDVINAEGVTREMRSYEGEEPASARWWWPRPSVGRDTREVLERARLVRLTNDPYSPAHDLDKDLGEITPTKLGPPRLMMDAAPAPMAAAAPVLTAKKRSRKEAKTRKNFPETWLWLNEHTGDDGSFVLNTTVPDTITSWQITAFSVSEALGLGISDKKKVTVFRNFFVSLNLPLKVIRGEVIIVQAIVFNYFDRRVNASLELFTNDKFQLIMPINDSSISGPLRFLQISPGDSVYVSLPLRMTAIGDVQLKATAKCDLAQDSLLRTVHVKPEGIRQCFTQSLFFSPSADDKEETGSRNEMRIKIPQDIVPGSAEASLHVYGDVMGSTMSNLGNLLSEPHGCGEQNMINFAPDVFVTSYLMRSGKLGEETRRKAFKHINSGYQNQLNYRRGDGSYSAWGSRDSSGSTWLTAFVIKCFKHAAGLDEGWAELMRPSIEAGVRWIGDRAVPDGSFDEPGRIIHRDMQGGANSNVTMAAYVAIALLEVDDDVKNFTGKFSFLNETQNLLERSLDDVIDDPSKLTMVAYALQLMRSPKSDEAFRALRETAVVEDDTMHWSGTDDDASPSYKRNFAPSKPPASSKQVEITSYALLTYVDRGDVTSAIPILKWLTSQQTAQGGFGSTQDTVVAIQAMSAFAERVSLGEDQNLVISFSQEGKSPSEVVIDGENQQVHNRFELEPVGSTVSVEAEGSGIGVVQLQVCYYVGESPFEDSPFDCSFDKRELDIDAAFLSLCCRLRNDTTSDDGEATGMVLYKLGLPTGFGFDQTITRRQSGAKMVEYEKGSANFYFDELTATQEVCAELNLTREEKVASSKPSSLSVTDYYAPERTFTMEYSLESLEKSDICAVCEGKCVGCEARLPHDVVYFVFNSTGGFDGSDTPTATPPTAKTSNSTKTILKVAAAVTATSLLLAFLFAVFA